MPGVLVVSLEGRGNASNVVFRCIGKRDSDLRLRQAFALQSSDEVKHSSFNLASVFSLKVLTVVSFVPATG
jgi:hypothetical protein